MDAFKKLSKREVEVIKELAQGYTEKEAAERLFLSPVTLHNHAYNIRRKIGAKSNLDMVVRFILSLDNPKQYFAALMFLLLQFGIVAIEMRQDIRRTPPTYREMRYSRSRHKIKENLYI